MQGSRGRNSRDEISVSVGMLSQVSRAATESFARRSVQHQLLQKRDITLWCIHIPTLRIPFRSIRKSTTSWYVTPWYTGHRNADSTVVGTAMFFRGKEENIERGFTYRIRHSWTQDIGNFSCTGYHRTAVLNLQPEQWMELTW